MSLHLKRCSSLTHNRNWCPKAGEALPASHTYLGNQTDHLRHREVKLQIQLARQPLFVSLPSSTKRIRKWKSRSQCLEQVKTNLKTQIGHGQSAKRCQKQRSFCLTSSATLKVYLVKNCSSIHSTTKKLVIKDRCHLYRQASNHLIQNPARLFQIIQQSRFWTSRNRTSS